MLVSWSDGEVLIPPAPTKGTVVPLSTSPSKYYVIRKERNQDRRLFTALLQRRAVLQQWGLQLGVLLDYSIIQTFSIDGGLLTEDLPSTF